VATFDVQKYGQKDDQWILSGIDKTQATMDEELTNLSNIQGSRYVKRLATEVNSSHEQLIIASDTLEQWKRCQRAWIYLDKIF
jgi:dynein heavy chain